MDLGFLRALRVLGLIEGTSTLFLFGVAMPLKYWGGMPLAVTIAGSIHGVLFLALCACCVIAMERVPIGTKLGLAGIVGAVIPGGPFVVDHWLKRVPAAQDVDTP
ncbi:MAG: DUF3817 domain-containing protein [Planctomycetota bacterium]